MRNDFYVGIVCHRKKFTKQISREKIVLYNVNDVIYLDLENNECYSTDCREKDYIEKESLTPTDISMYKIDYIYLLNRYLDEPSTKKKKRHFNA